MFLRLHVVRDPRLLWGPELLLHEQPVRRRWRALSALDDLQLHHTDQLFEWLLEIQEPDHDQDLLEGLTRALPYPPGTVPDIREPLADTLRGLPQESAAAPPPPPPSPAPVAPMAAPGAAVPRAAAESSLVMSYLAAAAPTVRRDMRKVAEAPAAKKDLRRRASIRWFRTMNPQRMYPLTVALAKGRIKEVTVKGVAQAVSAEQLVVSESHPYVTVRPVLPGMSVYPTEQTVDVTPDLVTVRFQVLPQMLGQVADARIEFYWRQRLLSKIDLPMKVRKQTLAIVVSCAGLLWPFLGATVKQMGGQEEPKDMVMHFLIEFLRWPHAIEVGLAVIALLAACFWWLNRSKESSEETDVLGVKPMSLDELLAEGRRCLLQEHWEEARGYFEDAVNVSPDSRAARSGLEHARQRRSLRYSEING
jgi:hypothetical protein